MKSSQTPATLKNICISLSLAIVIPGLALLNGCGQSSEDYFKQALNNYHANLYNEAIPLFRKAIEFEPENMKAKFFLGLSYKKTDQIDKAIEYIQQAREMNPNDFYILHHLADAYMRAGKHDKAVEAARQSLGVKPDYMESHFLLGISLKKAGKLSEAVRQLEFIAKLTPEENQFMYTQSLYLLGEIYRTQGKFEESRKALKALVNQNPSTPEFIYSLGMTYAALGQTAEAQHQVDKLAELNSPLADHLRKQILNN